MGRNQTSIEDRLKTAEKTRILKDATEKVQIEKFNASLIGKLGKPVRIIFYLQVLLSLLSFLFFPFKTTDVITSYLYEKYKFKTSTVYVGYLKTESGRNIILNSQRIHEAHFKKGDTIYVQKNFLFKTEGVTNIVENKTYFTNAKWIWCFIWVFALTASIISSFFKGINDLRIKGRFTIGLAILLLLYFIF